MAPNPEEMMSLADAAAYLGVSDRQIRRYVAQGYLKAERPPKQPGEKTPPVLYSRADLEAIKRNAPRQYDKPAPLQLVAPQPKPETKPDSLERLLAWLASLDQSRSLPAPAPLSWLSVEEAAAASGLSVAQVLKTAPLWEQRGEAIRGLRAKRADGGFDSRSGWKILRAALERPLPVDSERS